jgi:hypothetical protein
MTESARIEPEPIDAEFEPAENAPQVQSQASRRVGPPRMRSRSVTWRHLITASVLSAVAGGTVAIIVSNNSSNAPTGTLAREIDSLTQSLNALEAQTRQAGIDVVSLRSRLDSHGDRLNQSDNTEAGLRSELSTLASQVGAISGAGDGALPAGVAPSTTPLGILLARINKLERIVADATSSPETTREVQRAVADLSLQVSELSLANTTITSAFDRREAALAALENGMQQIAAQLAAQPATGRPATARDGSPLISVAASGAPLPVMDATLRAQTIRALSVLEAEAQTDAAFTGAHRSLAALLPGDASLSEIAMIAESGAPSLTTLRAMFDASATRAMRHAEEDSDDGWNWMRQAFQGVVTFAPSSLAIQTAGTLRTARRQLDIGDIRDAVTAVSGLPGRAGSDFARWQEKAVKRADLDDALETLNSRLLGAAASAAPTPTPG